MKDYKTNIKYERIMKYSTTSYLEQQSKIVGYALTEGLELSDLNKHDIDYVLEGKNGIIIKAIQRDGEQTLSFIKDFLREMSVKSEVMECQYMLTCLVLVLGDDDILDCMFAVNNFIDSLPKSMEVKWVCNLSEEHKHTEITLVCTNDTPT